MGSPPLDASDPMRDNAAALWSFCRRCVIEMQSGDTPLTLPFALSPLFLLNAASGGFADLGDGGFDLSRYLFLGSLLLSRETGGMDLSRVGEKIFSSVRSARSIGLLSYSSDRPEVPERAAAAAAVARVLAGLSSEQRQNISTSSEELSAIYGSSPKLPAVDELEHEFYEEDFDPIRYVLEQIPPDENEPAYLEEKAALRMLQLDRISECLSRHVMEHHEEMVEGVNLVRELERDLKIATIICMNGRRHLTSSKNEVSRDLVVTERSKRKQALSDLLPILAELHRAVDMKATLEICVGQETYTEAFQLLPEYIQLLDSLSGLHAVQDLRRGTEVWLGKTFQKLDFLLLEICKDFKEDGFLTMLDAYGLIDDVSGLAEKIQSFFMQEVISESHLSLRTSLEEDVHYTKMETARLTYSDLCTRVSESKFRQCLLSTLAVLFKLMCSYYAIMSFQVEDKQGSSGMSDNSARVTSSFPAKDRCDSLSGEEGHISSISETPLRTVPSVSDMESHNKDHANHSSEERDAGSEASSSGSSWFVLRRDAMAKVSLALQMGRKNLWHLTTSRVAVLLSSSAVCSTSVQQFLKIYEDLCIFILAGEAFYGTEATEFRQKLRSVCESYFASFHRQNIYALKMVMEKENWQIMPPDSIHAVSFPGLVGDALIVSPDSPYATRLTGSGSGPKRGGFLHWQQNSNPFLSKQSLEDESDSFHTTGSASRVGRSGCSNSSPVKRANGSNFLEEENEDLLADFIDEDSQLPSRISRPGHSRNNSLHGNNDEMVAQTGSSLSLLKMMDKYARLMQRLEIVNIEFFKGICQLFEMFFLFVYESFTVNGTQANGKNLHESLPLKLKNAVSRISQNSDQLLRPVLAPASSFPTSSGPPFASHMDITPISPPNQLHHTIFGLTERCAAADTIFLVGQLLLKSKANLQAMLLQKNGAVIEDFYVNLVSAVPELNQHIHRTTSKILLHVNGYVERIANAKWEVKELGLEHNGYVDLLLGEFKHFKTRIAYGGIRKEVQDLLLEYGLESIAETVIEGLSNVKRCTDEGRALMSLDLQVLINGLKHFVSIDVKQKLQLVDTFIKAYYLPETEFVHWSRAHPEYSKNQIVGLVNLVATMKGWKRKSRLEILDRITNNDVSGGVQNM